MTNDAANCGGVSPANDEARHVDEQKVIALVARRHRAVHLQLQQYECDGSGE